MIKKFILMLFMLFIIAFSGVFGAVQVKYTNGSCGCETSYELYDSKLFEQKNVNMVDSTNHRFGYVKNKKFVNQPEGTTLNKVCYWS